MYVYKLSVIILLGVIAVVYTNCGSAFKGQSELIWKSNIYTGGEEASYDAFSGTVYPLTRANCASCHDTQAPRHASSDMREAHDEIMMSQKVNFDNIPASRMIKKLRDENHNCWSNCEADASEMEAAITEWSNAIKSSTPTTPGAPVVTVLKTAQTATINEELKNALNPAKSNTVELNISTAMVNAPMVRATDGYGEYLNVPDDGQNLTLGNTDTSAGVSMINFRIPAAGTYRVWGYVLAADNNSNGFHVGIASMGSTTQIGGLRTWGITANANPMWRVLNSNFNITSAGDYTLTLREQKDGTKIYRIFVTADSAFDGSDVASFTGVTLRFDISSITNVPNSRFEIDVSDYDMYTYLLSRPRIVSAQNIRVKNIRPMLNNIWSAQNSAYTTVDKVVTPTDNVLSGFSMIVLKDQGASLDKLHFEFELLTAYSGVVNNSSLVAFENSVYPISRASCIACHTAQRPHASNDSLTAHDYAESIVNFNTPSNSLLVTKIRNGHQGISSSQGASLAAQYEAAIVQWRNGR